MAHWSKRAKIDADVVHFAYVSEELESKAAEAYLWDLDKTYLDTKFESLKGLLRTIFEKPFQKVNVAGTRTLVRCLKAVSCAKQDIKEFPIYFITASPPQMESSIIDKLKLDGIQPFGLFCKDNLKNLRPRRLWRLTHQIGYKLQALLEMRLRLGVDVREVMWGDDSESDVTIYCLYSDICARRMPEDEIRRVLKALRVVGPQTDKILELQEKIPEQDPVEKIYINLAEDTDAEYYIKFGRRVLPTFSTFQTALDLCQDGRLNVSDVVAVARDMNTNFGYSVDQLERSLDDLVRRRVLSQNGLDLMLPELQKEGFIHEQYEPSIAPRAVASQVGERVFELEGDYEPWVPEVIDYLHNYR